MRIISCAPNENFIMYYAFLFLQGFDKEELMECIQQLVKLDQEWVPYSTSASLYIRPTFIGTEVPTDSRFGDTLVGMMLLLCILV